MSMAKIEQRIETLEKQAAPARAWWLIRFDRKEGTISGTNGGPIPTPAEVEEGDRIIVVTSPPWDSALLRLLTQDELEERFPGRRERIAQLNAAWAGKVVFDAA